ncbi:MAG: 50S ribosomal protein L25 [Desulfotignum sp.]|nr:50S ribosomal protein L25 [Desulfobacteraceae bacterium]
MELITLTATKRDTKGKGAARKMRREKTMPAVIYGPKMDPLMLCLETSEFDKIIRDRGSSGLFLNLKIQGEDAKSKVVMLKDLQMDTYGIEYIHADFHQIDMDTLVTVSVPIVPVGVSKGVKDDGGMLQIIRRELEVVCKPGDTPERIEIDVTGMEIGDAVHVEEIDLGDAVEIPHDVNFTVITIVPPDAGEDEEELAEEELMEDVDETEGEPVEESSE